MPPKISVIIPTYNRAHLLERALGSVFAQTFQDLEVIVVDDSSTDDTEVLISTYSERPVRFLRHERNKGGGAARNSGIGVASGEYVAFLDSDDSWLPSKLEKQLALMEAPSNKGVGVVYTGYRKHGCESQPEFPGLQGDILKAILVKNFVGTTSTVLVRKKCLERVGGFDEQLPSCQDWDLWIRLAKHTAFACLPEPLVDYYRQVESISGDGAATLEGHRRMAGKYAADLNLLSRAQRAEYYLNLGKVFWWKRAVASSLRWFGKSMGADPSAIAEVARFLILKNIRKLLKKR